MRAAWFVLACAITACTGSPVPQPGAPPVPSAHVAPAAVIDLQPLTLSFDGSPIARLLPGGRTESVGANRPGPGATFVPGPTLSADGSIALTRGGLTARVAADGAIYVADARTPPSHEVLFGRISGDQLTFADDTGRIARVVGKRLVLTGSGPDQVLGMLEQGAPRTALVMTAAFYIEQGITAR